LFVVDGGAIGEGGGSIVRFCGAGFALFGGGGWVEKMVLVCDVGKENEVALRYK